MKSIKYFFIFIFLLSVGIRCAPPTVPSLTSSAAHTKFLKICNEEYGLDVKTFSFSNTLWIYLPLENDLYNFKANPLKMPTGKTDPVESRTLNFIDGNFGNGNFNIEYDISTARKHTTNQGYKTTYSEEYQSAFSNVRTAIYRAYAKVEQNKDDQLRKKDYGDAGFLDTEQHSKHKRPVHSHVKTSTAPQFFVLIIADIKNGLRTQQIFYLPDLLRAMYDNGFGEEFNLRVVNEELTGDVRLINDRKGKSLDPYDITWPEFLTKQTIQRIKYKYQRSDFPPQNTDEEEILSIVTETLEAYGFEDYEGILLQNLETNLTKTIDH